MVEGPWSGLPVVDTTQQVIRALTPQPPGSRDSELRQVGSLASFLDPFGGSLARQSAPRVAPRPPQAIFSLASNKGGVWIATQHEVYYRTAETVKAYPTPEPAQGAELSIT